MPPERPRRPTRARWGLAAPLAAIGLAGAAVVLVPQDQDPGLGAVGPVWSTPDTDLDALRTRAADDPARSLDSTRSSPTATPSRSPSPARTGFPAVEGCDASVPGSGVDNGTLGDEHLCAIGHGQVLRPDAAAALVALDESYAGEAGVAEGTLIDCVTDSYRSFDQQVELSITKPGLAAEPGTSNHGWGVAVDVGCGAERFDGALYRWLDAHGAAFGWHNPSWARSDGSRPEPWHWEFDPSLFE